MRRSLLPLLMVTFLILAASGCVEKPVTQTAPTLEAPKTDIAAQTDGTTSPADAPAAKGDTAETAKVRPAEAIKLMLLQLLVAR